MRAFKAPRAAVATWFGRTPTASCAALAMGALGWMATASATATQADQLQNTLTSVSADLAIVSNTASVRHAKVGQDVTFTVVATNNGPDPSGLPVHVDEALNSLRFVKTACDRGVHPDGPFFCEYSGVQPNESVTTTFVAEVQATGSHEANETACVQSGEPMDPDTSNNCATATLRIIGKR
jgi:uncharacterized repeat protein (TIGR01451 family)